MTITLILLIGSACTLYFLWDKEKKKKNELLSKLTTEQKNLESANTEIQRLGTKLALYSPIINIEAEIVVRREKLSNELLSLNQSIQSKTAELTSISSQIIESKSELDQLTASVEEHFQGFYEKKYEFEDVTHYADALELIREAQRLLLRNKRTTKFDGSKQNEKLYKDISRLAVNAFNGEFFSIVEAVSPLNFDKQRDQLTSTFDKINQQISNTGYQISDELLALKQQELALVTEFNLASEKSKEEQAELKAAMREEEKARVEAEKAREKAIKDQERYQEALEAARREMESKSEDEKAKYEAKIAEWQMKYEEAKAERERATAMAQITKKGHVYIISNIGSFGENVFKIGMTRRKEPEDRVHELSDASVPFSFDIHALIDTDDAPSLENALHREFSKNRVNMINHRKEFFGVSIDEIAKACDRLGYNIKLTKHAEAREYRETLNLKGKDKSAA